MSKLGELIDYTGDECPNCGRVRVEQWSCGKRICEKCHWCIEDNGYLYDDDEDEDYLSSVGFGVSNFFGLNGPMEVVRKQWEAAEKERLDPYEERAKALGMSVHYADRMASMLGMDIGSYLSHCEAMRIAFEKPYSTVLLAWPEPEIGGEQLTDAQIRKQLKYEKNPMRIKQLNKMLYGKRKR